MPDALQPEGQELSVVLSVTVEEDSVPGGPRGPTGPIGPAGPNSHDTPLLLIELTYPLLQPPQKKLYVNCYK